MIVNTDSYDYRFDLRYFALLDWLLASTAGGVDRGAEVILEDKKNKR